MLERKIIFNVSSYCFSFSENLNLFFNYEILVLDIMRTNQE